ncbi:hypothetical protein JVT61DRAFT_12111 [Boletus reticuloceps]|uniref:DUF6830 domain-containing protein n=1 Tax=Boletus reticuloceps TaxID=495285 RepID=A0A8I2YEK1_9AGAM|nr:hypothetical protein JVT61DRAFT_12111 [Boletus reticuloceps]
MVQRLSVQQVLGCAAALSSDKEDNPIPSCSPSPPLQAFEFNPDPGWGFHDQDSDFNLPEQHDDRSPDPEPSAPFMRADLQGHVIVVFNNAAKIYGIGETFLTRFDMDPYSHLQQDNIFYPFADLTDWRMANFLLTSKSSMSALDKLLSLSAAKKMPLSFWTAKELCSWAEILLSGPHWNSRIVPTTHPTKKHVVLYFRDALDCIELLFNHPFFADKMDYTSFHLFTTAKRIVRLFTEWMSSESTWEMQFTHPESRMCSVLDARLFHQCLNIILQPLKEAACIGKMMSNPVRNLCYCFTLLVSYIVDMPEVCMLACVCGKCRLSQWPYTRTLATHIDILPCTSAITLSQFDVNQYFAACEVLRLSGVSHPFWRDWPLAEPPRFISPEGLHHWYREFWDHDVRWCIEALGSAEINFWFSILPHITGLCHFSKGITKLKQVRGRTKQEVQRYIVIVIASTADPGVVIAIHAPAITSVTCDQIQATLQAFHDHKAAIIEGGLHWGQQMSSIEQVGSLLQWSADTTEHAHIEVIKDPASMMNNQNYDAQICRCLNQYQKCQLFDTAIALHTAHKPVDSQEGELDHDDIEDDKRADEEEGNILEDIWAPKCQQADLFKIATRLSAAPANSVPRPLRTFIARSTAICLNYKPLLHCVHIDTVAEMFKLPDLRAALEDYVNLEDNITQNFHTFGHQRQSSPDVQLPFRELDVWYKVHLQ